MLDQVNRVYHTKSKISTRMPAQEFFVGFASVVMHLIREWNGAFNAGEFASFLLEKHRAYGAEPLMRWGTVGIIIRMDSKTHRIVNMISKGEDEALNESIEDTLTDLLGYCVLGYRYEMYLEKEQSK
jgi:predicted HicB family RNase H-like nuclease